MPHPRFLQLRFSSWLLLAVFPIFAQAQTAPPPPVPGMDDERFVFDPDLPYAADIPSPEAFLGYALGERFTVYADVVAYLRVLAEASPRITLQPYGKTYEGRPLLGLVATSAERSADLEAARRRHLRLARPAELGAAAADSIFADAPVVLSFSYNIHGNEASSTEAAMRVVYRLAAAQDSATERILNESVVLLYPTINPDGRDRYVYWYNGMHSSVPSTDPADLEHYAPWPNGRTNHYWFDLNRDWIWGVHPESRGQVELYRRWMPQVHVDYHEQGYDNNYFTAPGTTPRNLLLPDDYERWTDTFGRANLAAFDARGISYFTRDRFDFFYPGYGSSYPSVMGAVGMLTEQGGIAGGLGVETEDGYVLTLRQRIFDHYTTTFTTLTAGARHREALLRYSYAAWQPASAKSEVAAYVFPDTSELYVRDLVQVLLRHGVEVRRTTAAGRASLATDYASDAVTETDVPAGAYLVDAAQPQHLLIHAILEPQLPIEDSVMYDMATWSAPLAYNVTSYRSTAPLTGLATEPVDSVSWPRGVRGEVAGQTPYAYLIDWHQRWAPRALAMLLERGYRVRTAAEPFDDGAGGTFPAGTLIMMAGRNRERADSLASDMARVAREARVVVHALPTGRMSSGRDIGNSRNRPVTPARIAMLVEPPFDTYTAGQLYFLFDQELGYPLTRIRASTFAEGGNDKFGSRYGYGRLADFDVLIVADGGEGLEEVFDSAALGRVRNWVRGGGTLICIESAAAYFARAEGFGGAELVLPEQDSSEALARVAFGERERYEGLRNIPGSALRGSLDTTHPLAFGLPARYYPIKFGAQAIVPKSPLRAVGTYAADSTQLLVAGYASEENLGRLAGQLFAAEQPLGEGHVVYLVDNPHYRMFWRGGSRLVVNAALLLDNF